ncbi:ABC transporter ATP-binding protein [Caldisalinibacter kiritimatiensis]|uniref:ABC transporter, ATP-binding protein n=1 Tax=Caldisalinibacter kiritimatiensis TaxID=1304284 RepID=R1CVC5_9FIRM|nr:ABC transporter ATP-binding protein [Caldisalinibacter kiritimatiensis]EOD00589.1 ABC transporter, ATP-binding protein [Caldisalinibacter kiritimatiensis]
MNQPVLELINVKKKIKNREIIKGINITVNNNEIFGFLGPNGAGKTTTLRMIVGLIKPSSGTIKICGYSLKNNFVKAMKNIGCIIENPEMYNYMSGLENLMLFSSMNSAISEKRIREIVEIVGLSNRIHDRVSTYSLGMRQRLGIAQAIISKPKLLILDEPTNGLDPSGIREFRELLKKLVYKENMSILISSHILSEIQQVCDRVAIISNGRIIKTDKVKNILFDDKVIWCLSNSKKASTLLYEKWNLKTKVINNKTLTGTIDNYDLTTINKFLIKNGINIKYVQRKNNTLEELFLELTEGDKIV